MQRLGITVLQSMDIPVSHGLLKGVCTCVSVVCLLTPTRALIAVHLAHTRVWCCDLLRGTNYRSCLRVSMSYMHTCAGSRSVFQRISFNTFKQRKVNGNEKPSECAIAVVDYS